MISALLPQLLTAAVFVLFLRYLYTRLFSRSGLPAELPWAGVNGNSYLGRARATLSAIFNTRDLVRNGYNKYSKNGRCFVLPNITTGPEVILPLSQMDWLLAQPDDVLSQGSVNEQFLQSDHTMLHPRVMQDTVHLDVIRKELTKGLGNFTRDISDEIEFAFRKHWGVNTKEWSDVAAYWSILDIIGRISNRVLVGSELCRNEEYHKNSSSFARLVVIEAVFISLLPKCLKPVFAPLVTYLDTQYHRVCEKYTIPIIKQRLAALSAPLYEEKTKNDYIQWSIEHSFINNDPTQRTADLISKRLSVLSFATIQSSVITLSNLVHDLAASPYISSHLATIRNEVLTELAAENGIWTKTALARMTIMDATLRESMRLWGFVSRGVLKDVVAKDGITLPNGMHIPQGVKVGIHAYPVHHDEDLFSDPDAFNPMRFREEGKKVVPLVTTSSSFMAFSHGRHACPGRFFATQQLKLVLAYIALNYDVSPSSSRPPNRWLVGTQGPPLSATIRIRRREGTV